MGIFIETFLCSSYDDQHELEIKHGANAGFEERRPEPGEEKIHGRWKRKNNAKEKWVNFMLRKQYASIWEGAVPLLVRCSWCQASPAPPVSV